MMRAIKNTAVLFVLTGFAITSVHAKTMTCNAYKGDGKGWIPEIFTIDLAEDRASAKVIEPVRDTFGANTFKKGLFGSDLWSRGKGKSKDGDYYNYQFQLVFDDNDSKARIVLSMQGYHPLTLRFNCAPGNPAIRGNSQSTFPETRRRSNVELARSASDTNLCVFAVIEREGVRVWDVGRGVDDYVNEAKRRGLSCGVSSEVARESTVVDPSGDLKSSLAEAKELFESGLISVDEYKKLKKKLLGL